MFLIRRKSDGLLMGRAGRSRYSLPKRGWSADPNDHTPYNSLQDPKYDGCYGALNENMGRGWYEKYISHVSGGWEERQKEMHKLWDRFYEIVEVEIRIKE